MDVFNNYGAAFGITIGVLSALLTFFNKGVIKARIKGLQEDNDDLRKRLDDNRIERTELEKEKAALLATVREREGLIAELKSRPDYGGLTKIISNNHKEIMVVLSELKRGEKQRGK